MLLCGCGYHVAGRASQLPPGVQTIAVPAFTNRTLNYRIEQRFTSAVVRELLARTKYRVIANPTSADAVLHGEITGIEASTVVFDSATGRATTLLVTVHMRTSLEERATNKVLYNNDSFLFRQTYEISSDVRSFFQEEGPALERMSRDFASTLVSDIVENF
jgi:outer membrane lipopolysaccharide assembly protein LptE/RlpB